MTESKPFEWDSYVKNYQEEKKSLAWGYNPKPQVLTHKIVKEKENIFNPVSQIYYDKEYNNNLKKLETGNIRDTIAKNTDRALRYEQTFNIINLKDKLKGFENHPDYPKYKTEPKKKNLENSRINYNILSNITADKHSYLPPEKRPIIKEEIETIKAQTVNVINYKDYDIITNKYKINHENKTNVDTQVNKLNAANNYWKTRDYHIVQGRFIDESKEQEFQSKRKDNDEKLIQAEYI